MNHCRELDEPIAISSITLQELNNIKENRNKSEQVRFKARDAARWIREHLEDVEVCFYMGIEASILDKMGLPEIPDYQILSCAYVYVENHPDVMFWTDDNLCLITAKECFYLTMKTGESSSSGEYTGWIDRELTDEEIAAVYERPTENTLGLLTNQYAVIKGSNSQEAVKWDGSSYVRVKIPAIKSKLYGTVKPYQGDVYQQMALDSMVTNQLTVLKGHAGTVQM